MDNYLKDLFINDVKGCLGSGGRVRSECIKKIKNGLALITSAITNKGVKTSENATFEEIAENIEKISGGGISYKAFYDDGKLVPYTLIEEG